ncbi:MAG: hypothetical protein Q4D60_11730 [Eubacteriales bacterium]|nr:hypothetical protein [Eubacteriales bacterium]
MDEIKLPDIQNEYLNNSKVANYISTNQGLIDQDICLELATIPKKNIYVLVNLYSDEKLTLSNPNISPYDMAVMDAAFTLLSNGATAFTPEMIVRTMSGNMEQKVTPQKIGAVTRSLNKLKFIRIRIDCTDEMIARKKIKKGQTSSMESYLMPLDEVEVKLGNQKIMKGYSFSKYPVLYTYAINIGQIISVPRTLLETKGALSDTDEAVVLKRYLIKRIEVMKNDKNNSRSRRITYEWYDKKDDKKKGMFHSLGYKPEEFSNWKKKKSNIHNDVKSILAVFVKEKYIKAFSEVKEGKSINGIDITL